MSKSDRTPKKIAGLKLPKEIREAPAVKALLATPSGRKLLEDALIEAAAAAAARVIAAYSSPKPSTNKKTPRKKPKPIGTPAIASVPVEPPDAAAEPIEPETPETAQPQIEVLDEHEDGTTSSGTKSAAE